MVTAVTVTGKEDMNTAEIKSIVDDESPVVKTIICRWVKEGLIAKIGTNLWQKIQ